MSTSSSYGLNAVTRNLSISAGYWVSCYQSPSVRQTVQGGPLRGDFRVPRHRARWLYQRCRLRYPCSPAFSWTMSYPSTLTTQKNSCESATCDGVTSTTTKILSAKWLSTTFVEYSPVALPYWALSPIDVRASTVLIPKESAIPVTVDSATPVGPSAPNSGLRPSRAPYPRLTISTSPSPCPPNNRSQYLS